jgi:hypothetical protein
MTPEQRKQAIERMVADDPTLSQRDIAKALGTSQKTVSRDVVAMRRTDDSATQSVPQPVSSLVRAGISPGEQLVAAIRAEMAENGLEPDSREEGLLASAARSRDRIAELEQAIAKDGLRRKAKDGRVSLHPAVAAIAQAEGVLARALSHIQLAPTTKNPVKQRAAQSRWNRHNLAAAARHSEASDGA